MCKFCFHLHKQSEISTKERVLIMLGKEWQAWARNLSMQSLVENKNALAGLHYTIKKEFEGLETVQDIMHLEYRDRIKKTEDDDYDE